MASAMLYNRIGVSYDTTRRADTYLASRIADLLELSAGRRFVDVACGTGNYTCALSDIAGQWYGVDTSTTMLSSARSKTADVSWSEAPVECLPYADGFFDGAICILAHHHFLDLFAAFSEVARVLGHGKLVVFTAFPEQMRHYWLNAYFPEAIARATAQMPSENQLVDALASSGLERIELETYQIRPDLQDFFLYSGKLRPEIYLSHEVRAGISTFADLADDSEVEAGCAKLAEDLNRGEFRHVFEQYRDTEGDYAFLVASRL